MTACEQIRRNHGSVDMHVSDVKVPLMRIKTGTCVHAMSAFRCHGAALTSLAAPLAPMDTDYRPTLIVIPVIPAAAKPATG